MKENRNDRQYGQTSTGQQKNNDSQPSERRMGREGSSADSPMGTESYELEDSDTYIDQIQNRGRESNQGTYGSEGSPSVSSKQRSGEYSPDDEIDDTDEMDDDDMVSRTDDDDDDDDM